MVLLTTPKKIVKTKFHPSLLKLLAIQIYNKIVNRLIKVRLIGKQGGHIENVKPLLFSNYKISWKVN